MTILKKYKNRFSFDMELLDSPRSIWFSAVWLMAALAIVKLLYIFFVTRRGVSLGWPFDSYLFDPFHRFTDWLIPYRWSEEINPWKENHPLLASLPPVPYGPITFAYLKAGHIMGAIISFFLALCVFLYLSFRVFLASLPFQNKNRGFLAVFLFTVLILVFYPIHFMVDRGNTDIIAAMFIAGIFLMLVYASNPKNSFNENYCYVFVDILIVLAAGSKPSWLPMLAFTMVSGSLKRICLVIVAVIFIYSFPLIFQGVALSDYIASIEGTYKIVSGVSHFSHNLTSGIRPFVEGSKFFHTTMEVVNRYVVLFGAIYSFATLVFCFCLRRKIEDFHNKVNLDILIFIHIIICLLLFNNPSPDYRLVVLLPALAAILVFWENVKASLQSEYFRVRSYILIIVFAFSVVASWTGFYMPSGFAISSSLRAWLLVLVDVTLLMLFRRIIVLANR